jgi:hypothetical protein
MAAAKLAWDIVWSSFGELLANVSLRFEKKFTFEGIHRGRRAALRLLVRLLSLNLLLGCHRADLHGASFGRLATAGSLAHQGTSSSPNASSPPPQMQRGQAKSAIAPKEATE